MRFEYSVDFIRAKANMKINSSKLTTFLISLSLSNYLASSCRHKEVCVYRRLKFFDLVGDERRRSNFS